MDKPAIKMPFGKYKDAEITDVLADNQYVQWLQQQSWVKERYPVIFQVIQQYNFEDQPTPEHNAMQIKWLDENYVNKFFVFFMKKYRNFEKKFDFELNGLFHAYSKNLSFERNDVDVRIDFIVSSISIIINLENCECKCCKEGFWYLGNHDRFCYETGKYTWEFLIKQKLVNKIQHTIQTKKLKNKFYLKENYIFNNTFLIELKPIVGDDYPTILRKMIRKKENVLICQTFESDAISLDQVKKYFAINDIIFILESEFMD